MFPFHLILLFIEAELEEKNKPGELEAVTKAKEFYKTCMNTRT